MAEQALPYEHRVDDFMRIVRAAQRDIAARVRAALEAGRLSEARRRRMQLASVVSVLDQLGAEVEPLARQLVAQAMQESAAVTASMIAGLSMDAPEVPGAFAGVSREAVVALQDAITGRLRDAQRTVGRTVADVYARAGRQEALRAVLGAAGSPRAAQREMTMELLKDRAVRRAVQDGGFGFVDRAGRRWALDTYVEMAVRTTTRQAVVDGALARMAAHGVTVARVSVHAKPCAVCAPWEGRLVSLDGQTGDHLGEAVADLGSLPNGGPPFHPNCRHSLMPVSVALDALRAERATGGVLHG